MGFSLKKSAFLVTYNPFFAAGGSTFDAIRRAKAEGFSAVEPFPYDDLSTVEQAKDLGSFAADEGLTVSCFSDAADLVRCSPDDAVAYMTQRIDMAAAMGSAYMHHTVFPDLLPLRLGEPDFHEMLSRAVPVLKRLCAYASDKGVTCLYENQGMYFNGVLGMSRLVEALDGVNFGLCADVGNCQFVDEPAEAIIGAFSARIRHVHCKDYLRKSGQLPYPGKNWYMTRSGDFLRDTALGSGVVNYINILRLLQEIGYEGYLSMDVDAPEGADFAVPVSLDYLDRCYQTVRASGLQLPG